MRSISDVTCFPEVRFCAGCRNAEDSGNENSVYYPIKGERKKKKREKVTETI